MVKAKTGEMEKNRKYYLTTAIPYPNDRPHIGFFQEIVVTDCVARFRRLDGRRVWFLTGNDENSANIVDKAKEQGVTPQEFCDDMAAEYQRAWKELGISNDDFICTTEERHRAACHEIIKRMHEAGDVYKGKYEGWYCESCNNYFTEKELEDGLCPAHKSKPKFLSEENYFFGLSKYSDKLEKLIRENEDFIRPKARRNEVLGIIKEGLRDVSISRARTDWGTPFLPLDDEQVIYVWVDALINYISALGFGGDHQEKMKLYWPADLHIIGKDIIRFHCLLWPAMLMSAGLEVPQRIFVHGFMTLEGRKMSKTLGNFIYAEDVCKEFGADAVKYFLLREYSFGGDGDFSRKGLIARINSDLANDLGNLLNRSLNMMHKYFQGKIEDPGLKEGPQEQELRELALSILPAVRQAMDKMETNSALATIWTMVRRANKYVEEKAPWNLHKQGNAAELQQVMYYLLESLRFLAILVSPFMPRAAEAMWKQLALGQAWQEVDFSQLGEWGCSPSPHRVGKPEALFPRIESSE